VPGRININRVLLFCVLLSTATLNAWADDTFHNIYHSLKKFFTGDDKHSSAAPQRKHPPLKHSHARPSPEESQVNSSKPRTVVLPEATPTQGDRGAKPDDSKAAETKAADVKAADLKAADLKAADLKAADVRAAETKPSDAKPAEVVIPNVKSPEPTPTANLSPVLRSVP
jgi:hypothetical protein